MKINFESSIKKYYIEILPTITITFRGFKIGIYIGFIFWSIYIEFKNYKKK